MLEDYKDILATVAGVVTLGQMFSGAFMCNDIRKAGSTKNFPTTPFVGGLILTVLFTQHGRLMKDAALGLVNFIGLIISVIYLLFFAAYSGPTEMSRILKELGIGSTIAAVLLGYTYIEDPSVVAVRFGIIITVFLFFLVSAPLFSIKTILKTRNTDQIPVPMVISGIAVSLSWLLYGIASHQDFITYQNVFMLMLNVPQLGLVIFCRKTKSA